MIYFTRDDFESNISFSEEPRGRILIPEQAPSPAAAAVRLDAVDKVLRELANTLNSDICRPREMPDDLVKLYEKVCIDMCAIRAAERNIIRG